MKLLFLSFLLLLAPQARATYSGAGSADQVLVVPHAGGPAKYGQVDLSQANAVKNQLPVANGGTNASTAAAARSNLLIPPVFRSFLSGSGTYTPSYVFVVTSANATIGATYTNNTQTFTIYATISAGTVLIATGTGAPTSSGTLTKATGTGDSTIAFSSYTNTPRFLRVRMVGGGGGGGGSGTSGGTATGSGGNTTFGTSLLVANGGGGGGWNNTIGSAGPGGSASLGTGPVGLALPGNGGGISQSPITGVFAAGTNGGGSPCFGGSPAAAGAGGGGTAGATNTGAGGGGAGGAASGQAAGGGGGSGGCVDAVITSSSVAWASSFSFAIGGGGTAGGAGGSGLAGGAGGSGALYVEENF